MSSKNGRTSKMAAGVVIAFNILTMIFCMMVFSISLCVIAAPSVVVSAVQALGNPTIKSLITEDAVSFQSGLAGTFLSGFFFCISLMGLYGAITASQFLLFMYATLVCLLLLLECALMFYFTSNLVEKGLREQDGQLTHALRIALQCCDRNYTLSFEELNPPWSCCGVSAFANNCTAEKIFPNNCQQAITRWLSQYETPIYILLAVIHIVLSSCSLLRRALVSSHSHT